MKYQLWKFLKHRGWKEVPDKYLVLMKDNVRLDYVNGLNEVVFISDEAYYMEYITYDLTCPKQIKLLCVKGLL